MHVCVYDLVGTDGCVCLYWVLRHANNVKASARTHARTHSTHIRSPPRSTTTRMCGSIFGLFNSHISFCSHPPKPSNNLVTSMLLVARCKQTSKHTTGNTTTKTKTKAVVSKCNNSQPAPAQTIKLAGKNSSRKAKHTSTMIMEHSTQRDAANTDCHVLGAHTKQRPTHMVHEQIRRRTNALHARRHVCTHVRNSPLAHAFSYTWSRACKAYTTGSGLLLLSVAATGLMTRADTTSLDAGPVKFTYATRPCSCSGLRNRIGLLRCVHSSSSPPAAFAFAAICRFSSRSVASVASDRQRGAPPLFQGTPMSSHVGGL